MSAPVKSATVSVLSGDPRLDHLVRGIGHVILMRANPEVAKALNVSGFIPGHGTPVARRAAGSGRHD